uniref:Thioredoxin O2 n=1 Tax=Rhizophora mucronata TaxID=61149 RepID=A0A2P2KLB3_RHIMU
MRNDSLVVGRTLLMEQVVPKGFIPPFSSSMGWEKVSSLPIFLPGYLARHIISSSNCLLLLIYRCICS